MNFKIGSLRWWKIILATLALAVASLAPCAYADTVIINFDSLTVGSDRYLRDNTVTNPSLPPGGPVTNYLAGYNVTLSGMPTGEYAFVYQPYADTIVPSPPNAFGAGGLNPIDTFTLNFSTPVSNFSFDRVGAAAYPISPSGTVMGAWSATAYNASGVSLGSVGDGWIATSGDVPIEHFTLAGPGISYINFTGDSQNVAGTALPHIDNLSFTTSPVPLPGAVLLLGSGLLGLAGWRRLRKG